MTAVQDADIVARDKFSGVASLRKKGPLLDSILHVSDVIYGLKKLSCFS